MTFYEYLVKSQELDNLIGDFANEFALDHTVYQGMVTIGQWYHHLVKANSPRWMFRVLNFAYADWRARFVTPKTRQVPMGCPPSLTDQDPDILPFVSDRTSD